MTADELKCIMSAAGVKATCNGDAHLVVPLVRTWPNGRIEQHYEWLVEYRNGTRCVHDWLGTDETLLLENMLWHSPQWEART